MFVSTHAHTLMNVVFVLSLFSPLCVLPPQSGIVDPGRISASRVSAREGADLYQSVHRLGKVTYACTSLTDGGGSFATKKTYTHAAPCLFSSCWLVVRVV